MGRPWIGPPIVGCWRHPERPCCACCAETLGFVDGNQIERENWVWGGRLASKRPCHQARSAPEVVIHSLYMTDSSQTR